MEIIYLFFVINKIYNYNFFLNKIKILIFLQKKDIIFMWFYIKKINKFSIYLKNLKMKLCNYLF